MVTARTPARPSASPGCADVPGADDLIRLADVRFLLPALPGTAAVHGLPGRWQEALAAAGVEVVAGSSRPDLVLCARSGLVAATAEDADAVVLLGSRSTRVLRRAGYHAWRVLAVPGPAGPVHLVPQADRRAASAAFGRVARSSAPRERLRDAVVPTALALGWAPARHTVTVAVRTPGPPLLLDRAQELGAPPAASWWLSLGKGDALQRGVLHAPATDGPGFVVKFSRVPGYADAFDRDARGLRLAAAAGRTTAARATQLLGRFAVSRHEAVVETRAAGRPLDELLRSALPTSRKLAVVEQVAQWLLGVARETAEPAAALAAERRRLEDVVLAPALAWGVPADLVSGLPPLAGVLVHDDLGTWNVLHDGSGFTVVDWESARRPGMPLWDLLYFLADALVTVAGTAAPADRATAALALFRGELPTSAVLFRCVRRAAAALAVPAEAVGPLATLAWLHHDLSPGRRHHSLQAAGQHAAAPLAPLSALARPWVADPALGPRWSSWC